MSDQLRLYLALIPGVITLGIASLLGDIPASSGVGQIVLLLFFSILDAAIAIGVTHLVYIFLDRAVDLRALQLKPTFLILVLCIAVANGFILVLGYENAWLNRAALSIVGPRSALLSKETNNPLLHDLLLNAQGKEVSFHDGRNGTKFPPKNHRTFLVHSVLKGSDKSIVGYRRSWDNNGGVTSVFLTPACVVEDGSSKAVTGSGAYFLVEEVLYFEFVDEVSEAASCPRELRAAPEK
ncbi:hypothetical protein KUV47_00470 [Vannielia litorea]|uniref:hypothetical protein n=1 Tax=Vannielia litorea TaxID=1217970 RepID=UPI001C945EC9|nr:hypothetical protein [Vannielia litorea]MBY6151670.1 hypothetical protein [Vannielia litorea]